MNDHFDVFETTKVHLSLCFFVQVTKVSLLTCSLSSLFDLIFFSEEKLTPKTFFKNGQWIGMGTEGNGEARCCPTPGSLTRYEERWLERLAARCSKPCSKMESLVQPLGVDKGVARGCMAPNNGLDACALP